MSGPRFLRRPGALAVAGLLAVTGCNGDGGGPTGPQTPAPSITTESLPSGTVGVPYTGGVDAEGGGGEYSWRLVGGSLPPGLATSVEDLTDDDLLITGTPEEEGRFTFFLEVSVPDGRADTAEYTIGIGAPSAGLAIATARLAPALEGASYTVGLQATRGTPPYSWRVSGGELPPGVSFGSDGRFSGSPTAVDTFTVTVEVTDNTGATAEKTFRLPVVPHNTDRYDITPFVVVDFADDIADNVAEAIRRWEEAITGNLEAGTVPDTLFSTSHCGGFGELVNGTSIDDMLMIINIDSIDGIVPADPDTSDILGGATFCATRGEGRLPAVGVLVLDEVNLREISSEELVTDIIQHEMAHAMGFGTLWDINGFDLLDVDPDSADPRYTGEEAIAVYQAAGGSDATIPVENEGGQGSFGSHWRESVFNELLMTSQAERPSIDMPLSRMTIASFLDQGYVVNLDAAEVAAIAAVPFGEDAGVDPRGWRELLLPAPDPEAFIEPLTRAPPDP